MPFITAEFPAEDTQALRPLLPDIALYAVTLLAQGLCNTAPLTLMVYAVDMSSQDGSD